MNAIVPLTWKLLKGSMKKAQLLTFNELASLLFQGD